MSNYSTSGFGVERRRRLYACLGPVLGAEQIWEALWLWEREFAEQAPFAIAGYAGRLAEHLQMGGSEQALLEHVTRGIQGPGDALPGDPIQQMLAHPFGSAAPAAVAVAAAPVAAPTAPAATVQILPPEHVVFNAFLQTVIVQVERRAQGTERDLMRQLGAVRGLGESARSELAAWSRGQAEQLTAVTVDEMRMITNAAYVWVCEELGPTVVDRIFGDATRQVDQLPEASTFSPRKLL